MSGTVKNIDEDKLYANLEYRFQYLCDFIGLSEDDISLIHGSAAILGPRVDSLVDAVYSQLFSFDCTKKVFFRKRKELDSSSAQGTLENYDLGDPQMRMRKSSLKRFIVRLVTEPYDDVMLKELDRMGRVHKLINVDLIHLQALLAYLQDAVIAELYKHYNSGIQERTEYDESGTVRTFCKVFAVLGQFISKWYTNPRNDGDI